MTNLKQVALEMLSNMKDEDITETLKCAGIDQEGIDVILKMVDEQRNNKKQVIL